VEAGEWQLGLRLDARGGEHGEAAGGSLLAKQQQQRRLADAWLSARWSTRAARLAASPSRPTSALDRSVICGR
jgi:hypothetical protein